MALLLFASASIGFFHTLLGPDHYIPFVAMSKSAKWSKFKTFWVTFFCGMAHVGSSIVLGLIGAFLGFTASRLDAIEAVRGEVAAWALIVFGLVYFVWGVRRAYRKRQHKHRHVHIEGAEHSHSHSHTEGHVHVHGKNAVPWILFLIFVFGPCEPLIPLLIYPAAQSSILGLFLVVFSFSAFTIGTMLAMVFAGIYGLSFVPLKPLGEYVYALSGAVIFFCGIGIKFFGL